MTMNLLKSAANVFGKVFSENTIQQQSSKFALNKGRMRTAKEINQLPNRPGIYRFVNQVTGTVDYVGQTNNIKRRINEHKRSGHFNSVIHKVVYGIAKADATRDALCFTEKQHIKKHRPLKNKTKGGNGRR